jgi:predicted permease
MSQAAVLHEIAVLLVVVAVGFALRRMGRLDDGSVRTVSRFVVDVAMPALLFVQLVETTDAAALRRESYVPILGAALILGLWGIAKLAAAPLRGSPTFVFVGGLPNWVYLPLPIVKATLGDDGVRDILLVNLGAMPILWTVGVAILRGGPAWRDLLLNGGLLASLAGVGVVLWDPSLPGPSEVWSATWSALGLVGGLTIPLSLLLTGAQIGASPVTLPSLPVVAVVAVRLLVGPLATIALLAAGQAFGLDLRDGLVQILLLVSAMPVAISAGMFAERFGGDVPLASAALLWTTPVSLLTVPLVFEAAQYALR